MNDSCDAAATRLLAKCKACKIEHCSDCDTVHLHIGHASLRLTLATFLSLSATLLEAARVATRGAAADTAHRLAN
jgi:hypothetical protein